MRCARLLTLLGAFSFAACTGSTPSTGAVDETGMVAATTSGSSTSASTGPAESSTGSPVSAGDSTSMADETGSSDGGDALDVVPEFALVDVNPTSATFEQPVSPRDHLEKVSGWYFTEAT